jgi:Single-strand binding protein family
MRWVQGDFTTAEILITTVIGNLGRDAAVRHLEGGMIVTETSVAVNRSTSHSRKITNGCACRYAAWTARFSPRPIRREPFPTVEFRLCRPNRSPSHCYHLTG